MRSTWVANAHRSVLALVAALLIFPSLSCGLNQPSPSQPEKAPPSAGGRAPARFLYAELVGESTSLWAASPDKLRERKELVRIAHEAGYGIRGAMSSDGAKLAYTALPAGMRATNQASLWLLPLSEPTPRLLAQGVDLPSAPVWAPDGNRLAYRRSSELSNGETETALYVVNLTDGKSTRVVTDSAALGLYPFAWSSDGVALYYSRVTSAGTDVVAIDAATAAPRFSYHVTDGIGRDFQLSPDGNKILYSSSENAPAGPTYSLSLGDLRDGSRATLKQGTSGYLGAVWRPDAKAITLNSEPTDPVGGGAVVDMLMADKAESRVIAPPAQGFDAPLAWSPDAAYLVVSHYAGKPSQPGARTLVLIGMGDGRRSAVESAGDIQFIGWVAGG